MSTYQLGFIGTGNMGGALAQHGLTDAIVCAFDAVWSGEAYPVGRIDKG